MRLLLDEQINPAVARQLRKRGHDVVTPQDLGTRGARDAHVLATALKGRAEALLTLQAGLPFAILTPGDFLRRLVE